MNDMKNNKGKNTLMFSLSLICFLIMSITFIFMGIKIDNATQNNTHSYITGACFWIFMIIGIVLQLVLSNRTRKWMKTARGRKHRNKIGKIGIVSFFKTKNGMVADILMIISCILLILLLSGKSSNTIITYVIIAVLVFSFCMHCIFNGKNYYFITHQSKDANEDDESEKDYKSNNLNTKKEEKGESDQ